jgi:hypothetical protein
MGSPVQSASRRWCFYLLIDQPAFFNFFGYQCHLCPSEKIQSSQQKHDHDDNQPDGQGAEKE